MGDIDYTVDKQPVIDDENKYDFKRLNKFCKPNKHYVMIATPAVAFKDHNIYS
jgi:hypothetical protein